MARRHNPVQQWKEATQFCKDYNMFIVEKSGKYHLYRRVEGSDKPTYLGNRGSVAGIRTMAEKCAGSRVSNAH